MATMEDRMVAARAAFAGVGVTDEEEIRRMVLVCISQEKFLPTGGTPSPQEAKAVPFFAEAMESDNPQTQAAVDALFREARRLSDVIRKEQEQA
jgi:hypothetical protein